MDENKLTLEDLGRKGYRMYQLKDGFRFGTDTVLLAWFTASFVKGSAPVKMLELGANCGAATLLVSARRDNVSIDALEIDKDAYEVLTKNIEINSLSGKVSAYEGDVRELPFDLKQKYLKRCCLPCPIRTVRIPESCRHSAPMSARQKQRVFLLFSLLSLISPGQTLLPIFLILIVLIFSSDVKKDIVQKALICETKPAE